MLKNSRSLRNLRERVEEKAARAPCVNCAGALRPRSVMTASPCWAAAGSRTRRTFGARRSEAPGPVRWAPGGVCARQPRSPAPPKLLGPQLLPSAWKPSQAWAGTAARRDGLYSWVENAASFFLSFFAASFFWGARVPIMLGRTMELNLISFSNRA